MDESVKTYFFGCIGQAGHYLWDKRGMDRSPHKQVPWGDQVDGVLTPKGDLVGEPRQAQGHTAVHRKEGWTAMAWWDRSGPDTRYGCNSVLFVEGEYDFEQMKVILKEHWPKIADRQPVELFL